MNAVNIIIKECLIRNANESMSKYPQYNGHFDDYVLVEVLKTIKTTLGVAFLKGDLAIAKPVVEIFAGIDGKVRNSVIVFSPSNKCDTSVPVKDIRILDKIAFKVITSS